VCPSRSWIVSKRINISSNFFSPSGSHTILVFLQRTAWQYSDGNPSNGGDECRWGRLKSRNQRLSGLAINNCCTVVCISHFALFVYCGYWTTKRDRRAAMYSARSTKRGVALYTVTVGVNRVYDGKARRHAEDNRTESSCTH